MRSRGMSLLKQTIASILPLDNEAAWAADARLNSLTKPPGSLGHLEELVRRYAAIRHDESVKSGRGAIAVFVADHGVADEGVSAFPQAVTAEMLRNIAAGGAAISVLARRFGYALKVVDVGVKFDTSAKPLAGRDLSSHRRRHPQLSRRPRDDARRDHARTRSRNRNRPRARRQAARRSSASARWASRTARPPPRSSARSPQSRPSR